MWQLIIDLIKKITNKVDKALCLIVAATREYPGVSVTSTIELSTGYKTRILLPYTGEITAWGIIENSEVPVSGDVSLEIKKISYSDYDTTPIALDMNGADLVGIVGDVKAVGTTEDWEETSVQNNDILEVTVLTVTSLQSIFLVFTIQKP